MGFWAAVPAIAGMISAVATGVKATKERNAKNNNNLAAWAPIAAAAAQNTLQGINNRKIRKYNEPKNQVRRLREAGLPLAAGSNITAGGAVSTPVNSFGFEQFNDNIGKGTLRAIDKKKLELAVEELATAKANAMIATGNAKNQLNPAGEFENTNQGKGIQQTLQQQEQIVKQAELINKWLPIEKAQGVLRNSKEIAKISADTANSLVQNGILISDAKIKDILSQWQGKMSQAEYTNIIRRNTGLKNANEISAIQGEILRNTKLAQIQSAQMAAISAGQNVAANNFGLILKGLETDSAKAYYKVKARVDDRYDKLGLYKFSNSDLLYLQLFTPTQSSVNLPSMSNIFK